jgi:hypothetical protein
VSELKETKLAPHSDIYVAVYWPGEGYGGGSGCKTMEEAHERVEEFRKLGYGESGRHSIRIVRTTREIIEFTLEATPPASSGRRSEGEER